MQGASFLFWIYHGFSAERSPAAFGLDLCSAGRREYNISDKMCNDFEDQANFGLNPDCEEFAFPVQENKFFRATFFSCKYATYTL